MHPSKVIHYCFYFLEALEQNDKLKMSKISNLSTFLLISIHFLHQIHLQFHVAQSPHFKQSEQDKLNGELCTWPDAASASVRRDTANHTCMHIWCAAMARGPWRAAIEVANVIVVNTARVLPIRKPPIRFHQL